MLKNLRNKSAGFTLIEILVVIGIIAVLAAIVLIAINPARQFAQARDSQRDSNVNAILNAVGQYIADNKGIIDPLGIPSGDSDVPAQYGDISSTDVDLCDFFVPDYITALPVDPTTDPDGAGSMDAGDGVDNCSAAYVTGYLIIQDSTTDRISVLADDTELRVPDIKVTR
ncbi:MAG: hypothetical protein A2826_01045 [Candidatus Doudnabacteria bacterium RIFCSPHIGHO2_01_FULL_43_23]|uniref:Type II secretion system protein GspG C-terminal domain-containing protein n=1 Tax=Candidatus Doudnabacteria bacterium RIFCSPHIGHO2_01_FULL_43_23 TaxID=1817822 RepID=A0A1F5NQV8_9BACT|nr:MAG: hypothetical protein A2826_01045 [Candidatus Doudnabacteria bacterium RIFCSPHIGHO2_01_FULL_43_23]